MHEGHFFGKLRSRPLASRTFIDVQLFLPDRCSGCATSMNGLMCGSVSIGAQVYVESKMRCGSARTLPILPVIWGNPKECVLVEVDDVTHIENGNSHWIW